MESDQVRPKVAEAGGDYGSLFRAAHLAHREIKIRAGIANLEVVRFASNGAQCPTVGQPRDRRAAARANRHAISNAGHRNPEFNPVLRFAAAVARVGRAVGTGENLHEVIIRDKRPLPRDAQSLIGLHRRLELGDRVQMSAAFQLQTHVLFNHALRVLSNAGGNRCPFAQVQRVVVEIVRKKRSIGPAFFQGPRTTASQDQHQYITLHCKAPFKGYKIGRASVDLNKGGVAKMALGGFCPWYTPAP